MPYTYVARQAHVIDFAQGAHPKTMQHGNPSGMVRLFDRAFNRTVQRRMAEVVVHGYRQAVAHCDEQFVEKAYWLDALADHRRLRIDQDWLSMMRRSGLDARPVPNAAGNCFHTRVRTRRVILTQSCVDSYNSMVRDAIFRQEYAEEQQLILAFAATGIAVPDEKGTLYGILLHGQHPQAPSQPGFIRVAFPARDLSCYVDHIDLLERFPELAAQLRDRLPREIRPASSMLRRRIAEESA